MTLQKRSNSFSHKLQQQILRQTPESNFSAKFHPHKPAKAFEFERNSRSLWQAPHHIWMHLWRKHYHQNMFIALKTINIICSPQTSILIWF